MLDELGIGEARDVAAAVYTLAIGVGKQRAGRDGSARSPKSWRVFTLSSGEITVATKLGEEPGKKIRAGQTVRLLDISADRARGFGAFDHGGILIAFGWSRCSQPRFRVRSSPARGPVLRHPA